MKFLLNWLLSLSKDRGDADLIKNMVKSILPTLSSSLIEEIESRGSVSQQYHRH